MAFHSIWVRDDRVRTSSCFIPPTLSACLPWKEDSTPDGCLSGCWRKMVAWPTQDQGKVGGVEVSQVWSLGIPVGPSPTVSSSVCRQQERERCWNCACCWQQSGDSGWKLSNVCHLSNAVVIHNQLQNNSHWVWLLFAVLVGKGHFREDFRGDCSYVSSRNDFDRRPFVLEEHYFMVLFISFLLQICFLLCMHGCFLISEESMYSSSVYLLFRGYIFL